MYIPQRVHFMLSVGRSESANIPVKAGMRENIINRTIRALVRHKTSAGKESRLHRRLGFFRVVTPTVKNQRMLMQ